MKVFHTLMQMHGQKYRFFLLIYTFLSILLSISIIATNHVMGEMSQAALELDIDALILFLLFSTIVMAFRALVSSISALISGRFEAKSGYLFRDRFVRYFLGAPLPELEKTKSGTALSAYSNDIPNALMFVTNGTLQLLADIIAVIFSFIYMFILFPIYTLIFFALFPLLTYMQIAISKPIQTKTQEMFDAKGVFNSVVKDSLHNTNIILSYGLEHVMEGRYLAEYDKYFAVRVQRQKTFVILTVVGIIATLIPIVFITFVAGLAVINGGLSIAEFIAITGVASITSDWLMVLAQHLTVVRSGLAGANRLINLTGNVGYMESNQIKECRSIKEKSIDVSHQVAFAFENVSFCYNNSVDKAINQVSCTIPKGSKVAIIGTSGSGKSTFLKLLLGLYRPDSGEIYLSRQPISSISDTDVNKYFSYVPQDSFAFSLSILENITGNKFELINDKVIESCRLAGILDFIKALPDKFETVLTELGDNVSGGQRQRIAIARAIYKNAPCLIFDEATSALDSINEANLLKSLSINLSERTFIIVTHRRSVVSFCDTIIVMNRGKISAIGSHSQLLIESESYRNLVEVELDE